MKKSAAGFSLIEIMVVVLIISTLGSVLFFKMSEASAEGRDAERRGELRNLQSALELYKNKNGRYPTRCANGQAWSGQSGTIYACNSGNQYIVGLAPEFIPTLPTDPRLNGTDSGYVYTVNADGTVYKLMAKKTVESQVVDYSNEFKSCDATAGLVGICNATLPSNNKPAHCEEENALFKITYAVWGGYANGVDAAQVERFTEDVICDIP